MEATETAVNILAQGKRNMVCGEIPTAVNQFQEACQLLSKAYGETAKECADAYFCYGQALLELARMENDVLGNALQGVPDTDDDIVEQKDNQFETVELEDQDREKLRYEVYDAMAEKEIEKSEQVNEKTSDETVDTNVGDEADGDSPLKINVKVDEDMCVKESSEKTLEQSGRDAKTDLGEKTEIKNEELDEKHETETEADKDDVKDVEMTDSEKNEEENLAEGVDMEEEEENTEEVDGAEDNGEVAEEANADEETTSQDGSQDEENADDISNLQLAWEMLELAKLIYLKDESKESKLRAAESHLKLGEVSLETEQFEVAVKDLSQCLEIQKTYLEPDNRLLAETYYQLGLAYCFNKQFTESTDSYTLAIKVIEERIMNLDKILATATNEEKYSKDFDSPICKAKKEVIELRELLPDIKAKLEDVEDEKKNLDEIINIAQEAMSGSSSSSTVIEASQSEMQTSGISHLIKRKKKSENILEDETHKLKQGEGDSEAADNVLTVKRKSDEDITPEESSKKAKLDIGDDGDVMDVELTEKSKSEVAAEELSTNKVQSEVGNGNAMHVELTEKINTEDIVEITKEASCNDGGVIEKCIPEDVAMKTKQESCDDNVEIKAKERKSEDNTGVMAKPDNGDEECISEGNTGVEAKPDNGDGEVCGNEVTEQTKCDTSAEAKQNMGDGDTLDNELVEKYVPAMET